MGEQNRRSEGVPTHLPTFHFKSGQSVSAGQRACFGVSAHFLTKFLFCICICICKNIYSNRKMAKKVGKWANRGVYLRKQCGQFHVPEMAKVGRAKIPPLTCGNIVKFYAHFSFCSFKSGQSLFLNAQY